MSPPRLCYAYNIIQIQSHLIPGTRPQLSVLSAAPAHPTTARIAILHGYGDHAGRFLHFMQWMADHGIACHAIDFRGHGRSAGKIGFIRRWDEYLDDVTAFLAIEELAPLDTPLFMLGHSHGGLVAAAVAQRGQLNHCRGIILSSPYFKLKMPIPFIKRFMARIASQIYPSLELKSGISRSMLSRDPIMVEESETDPLCRGIATPRWFFEARKAQTQVRANSSQFNRPLLMLVPGNDTVADPAASVEFFDRCKSTDKTILHYPEHRHEVLRELGRETIFQSILDWIGDRNSETRIPESMTNEEIRMTKK